MLEAFPYGDIWQQDGGTDSKVERFVTDSILKSEPNGFHVQQLTEDDYGGMGRSELHQPGQKSLFWPPGCRMFLVRRASRSAN